MLSAFTCGISISVRVIDEGCTFLRLLRIAPFPFGSRLQEFRWRCNCIAVEVAERNYVGVISQLALVALYPQLPLHGVTEFSVGLVGVLVFPQATILRIVERSMLVSADLALCIVPGANRILR